NRPGPALALSVRWYRRSARAVPAGGDGGGAIVRPLRPPAHGDPDGARPRRDLSGGRAAWVGGPQLHGLAHQEDDHRSRSGPEGTGPARHPARAGAGAPARAARRGRRPGGGVVPLLRAEVAGPGDGGMITGITGVLNRVLEEG